MASDACYYRKVPGDTLVVVASRVFLMEGKGPVVGVAEVVAISKGVSGVPTWAVVGDNMVVNKVAGLSYDNELFISAKFLLDL